jgi:hypothetical protein
MPNDWKGHGKDVTGSGNVNGVRLALDAASGEWSGHRLIVAA